MEQTDYKKRCEEYERRMGIGQSDPAKRGYLVLVEILHQQNEFLSQFKIDKKISSEEKVDILAYKNAKDLWENLPTMISNVSTLRMTLKMDGEDVKNTFTPVSPQSISKTINQ